MVRPDGTKSAKVIQVIETVSKRGLGTEKDPVRDVTQYWDLDGNFLAEADNEPQYLSDRIIWESERLKSFIESSKEN